MASRLGIENINFTSFGNGFTSGSDDEWKFSASIDLKDERSPRKENNHLASQKKNSLAANPQPCSSVTNMQADQVFPSKLFQNS